MMKIPSDVRELLTSGHSIWVATTGPDGMPNVSIKASGTLLDEDHLYFADMYSRKTRANLERDPHVAVGVFDEGRGVAVQLKGTAELIEDGSLFDSVTARLADLKDDPAAAQVRGEDHGRVGLGHGRGAACGRGDRPRPDTRQYIPDTDVAPRRAGAVAASRLGRPERVHSGSCARAD